jgi:hypothetical protein
MNCRGFDRLAAVVLQLEVKRIARLMIPVEQRSILRRAVARHRLSEELEHGLNELVSEARAKLPPGSVDVRVDLLKLRMPDDHSVKTNRVTHPEN